MPGTKNGAQFKLKTFGTVGLRASAGTFVVHVGPERRRSPGRSNRDEADDHTGVLLRQQLPRLPGQGRRSASPRRPATSPPPAATRSCCNALDGADTDRGMPDGNHIDNANMSTPPDGIPPTMQMYLWHIPGARRPGDWRPVRADQPARSTPRVEYHEYTHGLSNRLVIDANGNSTLNGIQAGSMGEAWSDYYAMDYLVTKGFLKDTAKAGEVFEGKYVAAGRHLVPHHGDRLPGRRQDGRLHLGLRPGSRVATPTATSRPSIGAPRCTAAVRSGPRPCGTSARRSGTTWPTP